MPFHSNYAGHRHDKDHGSRDMKLQDVFLNHCRREKIDVSIQLMDNSVKNGQIIGFDALSIILETNARQHLIYKSAVVAVNPKMQVNYIFNESYRQDGLKGSSEYATNLA